MDDRNSHGTSLHTLLQIVCHKASWKTADWDHILFPDVVVKKSKTNGCRAQLIRDMNLHELHLEFGRSHHALNHIRRNHFVDSQVLSILLLNAEEWLEVWLLVMSEKDPRCRCSFEPLWKRQRILPTSKFSRKNVSAIDKSPYLYIGNSRRTLSAPHVSRNRKSRQ